MNIEPVSSLLFGYTGLCLLLMGHQFAKCIWNWCHCESEPGFNNSI